MRLLRVQVQNFRSIVDSGVVDIEERVTVLIGKNEQGKTNFLKGVASFNPKKAYAPNDLPNHLRPALEEGKPSDIPMVTLWLSSEPADRVKLRDMIPDFDLIEEFKITKYYDGHYESWAVRSGRAETRLELSPPNIGTSIDELKRQAENLRTKLMAHTARVAAFEPSFTQAQAHIDQFLKANFGDFAQIDNLIKTLSAALMGLPAQDQAIQEEIGSAMRAIQATQVEIQQVLQRDPLKDFERRLPHFLFHSAVLDRVPNEVNIADFIRDPQATSKGMANLCTVAGLSTQKIQELSSAPSAPLREVYEDHYRGAISGGLNEFWTQETYTVHFRIERERLSVSISDNTYSPRITPSDRSDGFQWYLSFYSALLSEVSPTDPTVLLLDNPALELHGDGQWDIKRFLEEKLPPTAQVIYVTHSPAMIDPYNLEQIRQVELLKDKKGTKVDRLKFKEGEDADLLEPVRSAIGARLVSSLILNDFNVLVEGAADKPMLEGAFQYSHKEVSKKILVNGSIAETKEGFLPRFYQRAGLPFVVFVDGDSRGRELAAELERWGIAPEKIVQAAEIFKEEMGRDFELEDLLSVDFYHQAVKEAYPEHSVEPPKDLSAKRTKYYEGKFKEAFGIGFNKRRVSEMVKKLMPKADTETLERLKRLTERIWAALQEQVKPGGKREE